MSFPITMPSDSLANSANITAVYLWPNDSQVAVDFPAPAESGPPVRQAYIEVSYSNWSSGDPLAHFQADVKEAPASGKTVESIEGVPALEVQARSPSDADQTNPAFLRFASGGVDIQISGGDSLGALVGIAKSILRS